MSETKSCPYCGETILSTAVKCRYCGEWLNGNRAANPSTDHFTFVKLALASKYELKEEVGKGGMAIVYKAVQKNLERQVALKVLSPQSTLDKEFLERFHREARTAAKLRHPNIVMVFDEGVESGVHFIAMEYLEGIDLHSLIRKKGALSIDETISIILPIVRAVDYAHMSGVIHRDIKSANIFVSNDGRPILTDFGIAHGTVGPQLTVSGSVLGTPEFMSPEQADGRQIDNRSDIYSLGVVMYHALTGRLTHIGENPLTIIYKLINEPHTPISQIKNLPDWLEFAVEGCLIKDVNKRIQSGKELAKVLESRMIPRVQSTIYPSATVKIDPREMGEIPAPVMTAPKIQKVEPKISHPRKIKNIKPGLSFGNKIILGSIVVLISILSYYLLFLNNNIEPDTNQDIIYQPETEQQPILSPPIEQPIIEQPKVDQNVNIPKEEKQEKVVQKIEEVKEEKPIEEMVIVPNTETLQLRVALSLLRNRGLKVTTISLPSSEENKNIVIKQSPTAGSSVKKGETVLLTVGE